MKRISKTLAAAALTVVMTACNGGGKPSQVELPDLAQMFLSQNYANAQITEVTNDSAAVYKVALVSGTQLQFNSDGMWMKVQAKQGESVEPKVLPFPAQVYLHEIYPEKKIAMIERDISTGLMRVTLSDGLEIVFTSEGEVI
ncbi:MAG: PepSY-like domain-containing protein [Muribaculaceae bacterium]